MSTLILIALCLAVFAIMSGMVGRFVCQCLLVLVCWFAFANLFPECREGCSALVFFLTPVVVFWSCGRLGEMWRQRKAGDGQG